MIIFRPLSTSVNAVAERKEFGERDHLPCLCHCVRNRDHKLLKKRRENVLFIGTELAFHARGGGPQENQRTNERRSRLRPQKDRQKGE